MSIGQVMLDVAGLTLSVEDKEVLQHPQVGGLILFTRNYASRDQLCDLTASIKAINPDIIIAVDQEGGRVQRFKEGFTPLAPLGDLGQLFDTDPKAAFSLAAAHAKTMAEEILAVGVDLSFSPILDRNIGVSSVIGDRSFHAETDVIEQLATIYINAMHAAGVPAIGKHFPGHGSVAADSHFHLPVDTRDFASIEATDLQPFKRLAPLLDAVMMAHVVYQQVSDLPAGFEPFWIKKVLRQQCGFTGVVFSDCLSMAAARGVGSMSERADLALAAGCDMVLVCNDRSGALEVLEHLGSKIGDPMAQERLATLCRYSELSSSLERF